MEKHASNFFGPLMENRGAVVCRRCVYFALSLVCNDARRITLLAPLLAHRLYGYIVNADLDLREGSLHLLAAFAKHVQGRQLLLLQVDEVDGASSGNLFTALSRRQREFTYDSDYEEQR